MVIHTLDCICDDCLDTESKILSAVEQVTAKQILDAGIIVDAFFNMCLSIEQLRPTALNLMKEVHTAIAQMATIYNAIGEPYGSEESDAFVRWVIDTHKNSTQVPL